MRECDWLDDPYLTLACYDVCARHDCSCTDAQRNVCDRWGYAFSLPAARDEQLYQSCMRAFARDTACGEHTLTRECDVAARVEDVAQREVYACVEEAACNSGVTACLARVPSGTLGREYCATRAACADIDPEAACEPGEAERLDAESGRLRPEAIAAARTCLDESCADVTACMESWRAALALGDSSEPGGPDDSSAGGAGGAGGEPGSGPDDSSAGGAGGEPGSGGTAGSPSTDGAGGAPDSSDGYGGAAGR
jgi:hypothetical protein